MRGSPFCICVKILASFLTCFLPHLLPSSLASWAPPRCTEAVYVSDTLIPISCLINGSSIVQVKVDAVTYYHVELAQHDVLLAEGLPAESYLDADDRANFANGATPGWLAADRRRPPAFSRSKFCAALTK